MVDTLVLGTNGEIREGSSPFTCTNIINYRVMKNYCKYNLGDTVYFHDYHCFCISTGSPAPDTYKSRIVKAIVVGRNVLVNEYLMPSKFNGGVAIRTTSSVVYKVRYHFSLNEFIDISVTQNNVFGTYKEAIRACKNIN